MRMAGCFLGGVALCRAWRLLPARARRRLGLLADGSAAVLVLSCLIPHAEVLRLPACAGLVVALASQAGAVNRILSGRVAMVVGRLSFPLYLVHVTPLLWLVYWTRTHPLQGPASGMALAVYGCACLALAEVFHRLVERPAHRMGRRLAAGASAARRSAP